MHHTIMKCYYSNIHNKVPVLGEAHFIYVICMILKTYVKIMHMIDILLENTLPVLGEAHFIYVICMILKT